ncbi:MAG: hypothetical protein ACI9CD_000611 [Candidatus Deianiraeaceae bacterium]|jgi:hypothetical protein
MACKKIRYYEQRKRTDILIANKDGDGDIKANAKIIIG